VGMIAFPIPIFFLQNNRERRAGTAVSTLMIRSQRWTTENPRETSNSIS
jgi:hypothetical protein